MRYVQIVSLSLARVELRFSRFARQLPCVRSGHAHGPLPFFIEAYVGDAVCAPGALCRMPGTSLETNCRYAVWPLERGLEDNPDCGVEIGYNA